MLGRGVSAVIVSSKLALRWLERHWWRQVASLAPVVHGGRAMSDKSDVLRREVLVALEELRQVESELGGEKRVSHTSGLRRRWRACSNLFVTKSATSAAVGSDRPTDARRQAHRAAPHIAVLAACQPGACPAHSGSFQALKRLSQLSVEAPT